MDKKLSNEQEQKLDAFLKAARVAPPQAPSDEWEAIVKRTQAAKIWKFPAVGILAPLAMTAALFVVLWAGNPTPSTEAPVEAYLMETMGSLYQGELDDALGEWAYLVEP